MNFKNLTKNAFLAIAVFGIGLYRLGAPFLEETEGMQKESAKLAKEIQQVRLDAAQYDKAWEKKIEDADRKVKARLPDKINSSEVLDYFVTQFDKAFPGSIAFQSATQSSISPVSFGINGPPESQPRAAHYRFEALMHQTKLIPYVEHMEKYNGLFKINEFTFAVSEVVGQADTLRTALYFEFYLSPMDWVPKEKTETKKKDANGKDIPAAVADTSTNEAEGNTFRGVFVSSPVKTEAPRAPAAAIAQVRAVGKVPKFEKIVGTSVVSDENIYEEGDDIGPWKIIRVDTRAKSVTLKSGTTVRTVVVK